MRSLAGGFLACSLLFGATAFAQDTGLTGTARDASGAVLPGVAVEAASPALIERVRSVVTDDRGEYRIVDLRPGAYTVTFTLPGFATIRREGIELTAGFTASVNAEMRVGALEETITVSGNSPIVDTSTTAARKTITKEAIDALPTGKNWNGIGVLTVGVVSNQVDVGGSSGEQQNQVSVHGGSYTDNIRTLDGMMLSNMACNYSCTGLSANDSSTQELTYDIGALSAEIAGGGIRINIIPKEGGNRFSGTGFASYASHAWQSDNLDDDLKGRGITAIDGLHRLYDSSIGFGGPIKRDKLWFWLSQKYWGTDLLRANDYWSSDPFANTYTPDLSRQAIDDQWNESADVRLTWQMSQRNKISAYYNFAPRATPHWTTTSLRPPEAANLQRIYLNHFETLVFRSAVSSRMLIEAGAGNLTEDWTREPIPDGPSSLRYAITESANGRNFRAYSANFSHNITEVRSFRSSLSYVTGSHAFKFGWTMQSGPSRTNSWHGPLDLKPGELGDISLTFLNGNPTGVTVYATPYTTLENLDADLGLFAQDQWAVGRLTLNLALRYDWMKNSVPAQDVQGGTWLAPRYFDAIENVPNWKDIGPRVGVAYDVFGNGRTAVKATVSRYVTTNSVGFARLVNPINTTVNSTTRPWTDANNDLLPQLSELGALGNTNFGKVTPATFYDDALREGWGVRPGNWEYSGGFQHELRSGVGVDVAYFRRSYFNHYALLNEAQVPGDFTPYCITAPIDPRLPGDVSGKQLCGFYDVDPLKYGVFQNHAVDFDQHGDGRQSFNGLDVQANARLSRNAFLTGGFSTGRLAYNFCEGEYVGSVSTVSLPQGGGVATGETFNFPNKRFCDTTYPFQTQAKIAGAYTFPHEIQVSSTFQSYPGPQITANWTANASVATVAGGGTLNRPLAGGVRTIVIPLVAPGAMYGERRNQLDVRVARNFRFQNGRRLQVLFDVYNVANTNAVVNQNNAYSAAGTPNGWLTPTNIVIGRFFKMGTQITF
jgi:hypothetical protein